MDRVIENIFAVNLGVRKEERVLVFTDILEEGEGMAGEERKRRLKLREIAKEVARIGEGFGTTLYAEFPSGAGHGVEPPRELWECAFGKKTVEGFKREKIFARLLSKRAASEDIALAESIVRGNRGDAVRCVIALSNYSTSHTRFRKLLTGCASVRYASMPLFEESMLKGAMTADWNIVKERTLKLASLLSSQDTVSVEAPNGTSISFSIKGREVSSDTGILTEPGSFGNLPAGEAFVAPVEGSSEGTMVIEWAPTGKLATAVTLKVGRGMVEEVSGEGEFAGDLRERLSSNPLCANIAEFGVGTNDMAKKPDNILEGEKILGTIHIALGDNSTFGGTISVPFHQDFIFFSPTVEARSAGRCVTVVKGGRLVL